jgi:hypothetical protein
MVMLFPKVANPLSGPKPHAMNGFTYLSRSTRPEAARVRQFLEECLSGISRDEDRAELAKRLANADQHLSTAFELVVHRLLQCAGFRASREPTMPNKGTHPDFLVTNASQDKSFYLECCRLAESDDQRANDRRLGELRNALDKMPSPDYFFSLHPVTLGRQQPSATKIKAFLQDRLASLTPGQPVDDVRWTWKQAGWHIQFGLMPKTKSRGLAGVRTIGATSSRMVQLAVEESIRAGMKGKATKYGPMDRPYVVAVNVPGFPMDDLDIMNALFGDETFWIRETSRRCEKGISRERNGFWGSSEAPKNSRVSAALIFGNVDPWNLAQRRCVLVHNPWAKYPLVADLQVPYWTFPGGRCRKFRGRSLRMILGLPRHWPG